MYFSHVFNASIKYVLTKNMLNMAVSKHMFYTAETWSWSFLFSFSNAETIVLFQLDSVKFPSAET